MNNLVFLQIMSSASVANILLTPWCKSASKPSLEESCSKHEECKKTVNKGGEVDLALQSHPLYQYCQIFHMHSISPHLDRQALYKPPSRPTKGLSSEPIGKISPNSEGAKPITRDLEYTRISNKELGIA